MNIILTVLVAVLLVLFIGFCGYIWLKYNSIQRGLVKFISPIDEKTASPLTQVFDQLVNRAAQTFATQFKASIMGSLSAQSRQAKAIESDIAQDMASSQSPILAGLLSSFPSLSKRLSKNPQLMQALLPLVANLGINTTSGNGKTHKEEPFDINKFGG